MDSLCDPLWQLIQGKMSLLSFEPWCYEASELEALLGKDLYLELISTRFDDPEAVQALKSVLDRWLQGEGYPTCECSLWTSLRRMPLTADWYSENVKERFALLRERTRWLALRRCRRCGQAWYVACDAIDDEWDFRRMSKEEIVRVLERNLWPDDFDGQDNDGLPWWK